MLVRRIKSVFESAVAAGLESPRQLALAFCFGLYVAFSPFPGFHMLMLVATRWLLGLNFPVMFIAATLNNLWTMGPIYGADYAFGYWLLHTVFHFDSGWTFSFQQFFGGASICLPSFFIGGNLLGLAFAVACYPAMLKLFTTLWFKHNKKVSDENYSEE